MPRYLMEDPIESERLEIKTRKENVLKELSYIHLDPGLKVLDVGCGTGAVSRILAEQWAPSLLVGADFSPERLSVADGIIRQEGKHNIRFVGLDLLNPGLKPRQFDVVYSRCLFQYLPGPQGKEAIRKMKELAKPGGRVVVADVDGVTLYRFPHDELRERGIQQMLDYLVPFGFDSYVGRKLYSLFCEAGFRDIRVDLLPYYLIAGKADPITIRVWEMKVEIIAKYLEKAFGSREKAEQLSRHFLADFQREDVLLYNFIFLVQGTV